MDREVPEVDHAMDWNEEIQSLVRDIQMEAVIIELCRLAVDKQSPAFAEFSSQIFSEVLARSSSCLEQRSHDLFVWSQELASRTETEYHPWKEKSEKLIAK